MTEIIGIFGLQGWGKTALTTGFGYLAYLNGFKIYSNYPVKYDYTPIRTLEDAKNCRNGFILFDEFWKWIHARTSQSKINKEMMAICLLNRKRNNSIIYNTQLPRTIDVILRDVTNYRYLPHLVLHDDGNRYIHYVMKDLLGRESKEMFFNMPIDELGKLFDTHYEIFDILEDKKSFLEEGKILEEKALKTLKKLNGLKATRFKNSGIGTDFKGDLLISKGNINYLCDVKGSYGDYVVITSPENKCKDEIRKLIDNASQWNFKPVILFPKVNISGNQYFFPNNWFVYKIDENTHLLNLKSHIVQYSKVIKNSVKLNKW